MSKIQIEKIIKKIIKEENNKLLLESNYSKLASLIFQLLTVDPQDIPELNPNEIVSGPAITSRKGEIGSGPLPGKKISLNKSDVYLKNQRLRNIDAKSAREKLSKNQDDIIKQLSDNPNITPNEIYNKYSNIKFDIPEFNQPIVINKEINPVLLDILNIDIKNIPANINYEFNHLKNENINLLRNLIRDEIRRGMKKH